MKTLDISNVSTRDMQYLNDLKTQLHRCVLVADKGYLSCKYQLDLFETSAIRLEMPKRRNQKRLYSFQSGIMKSQKTN